MPRIKLTDEEKAARKAEREKKKSEGNTGSGIDDEAKKKILERAERLAKELDDKETEEVLEEDENILLSQKEAKDIVLKEVVKVEEKKEEKKGKVEEKKSGKSGNTLIPLDDYVKAGCYIGTKVITPDMRKYVYRRRADGIAIINTNIIDQKIGEAAKFISAYSPKDFVVVCKREAGWRAVKLFSELTGVRVFTKKYPAGIITNTCLPDFFETELIVVCDPWLDKNAMKDAVHTKKKVLAICDTNNLAREANFVVPANNKSNKSLGVIFYILTREYMKAWNIDKKLPPMEDFIGEKLENLPMKRNKKAEEEKKKDIDKIEGILKIVDDKKNE